MESRFQESRQHAADIFNEGLSAAAPGAAIKNYVKVEGSSLIVDGRTYDLGDFDQITVIGAGKAGASMALAVEELLGDRITRGCITVKYGHVEKLRTIKINEAGHPVPDENGYRATQEILELANSADEKTLVICLISGGGSALTPLSVEGVSLGDKQETTRVLLACGATIHEINAIRKHLSLIKGGKLARAVFPATLVTLILSDVVGDDLDTIASGPCVPDSMTFQDCMDIISKYDIEKEIPQNVLAHLKDGLAGKVSETPKEGEEIFSRSQNVVVGSNFNALMKAKGKADELGYNTILLSSMIEGETRDVAENHMTIAREIELHGYPVEKPACILTGGETTVTIKGTGKGGRNQEFVLAAARKVEEIENVVILSGGTDGNDGPTDAAGAFADSDTLKRAADMDLDPVFYLNNNDSYHFFEKLGDLFITGPTNTNVMDVRVILVR